MKIYRASIGYGFEGEFTVAPVWRKTETDAIFDMISILEIVQKEYSWEYSNWFGPYIEESELED